MRKKEKEANTNCEKAGIKRKVSAKADTFRISSYKNYCSARILAKHSLQ